MKVTFLCGGFGAARFLAGVRTHVKQGRLDVCCVVNTGDDLDYLGLRICPDLDSVCYALAGRFNETLGWGPEADTFRCADTLSRIEGSWFRIGDEDFALHLLRTQLLRRGAALSDAVAVLADALNIESLVLPMSDDPVHTMVDTDEGLLPLQEYLVARRAQPNVTGVYYQGDARARAAPGVLDAISNADVVILAPSNPVSSIGPILAVPGVRGALAGRTRATVAVTPVVRGREPATLPERGRAAVRAAFMAARGRPHRPLEVAKEYAEAGLIDGFVLDGRDGREEKEAIEALGIDVLLADTLAGSGEGGRGRTELVRAVVDFASNARRASSVC